MYIPTTWALFLLISHITFSYCIEEINVDLDDILSPKYMPNIFFIDNKSYNISGVSTTRKPEGSIKDALSTMTFHRTMMNQYLCRNYVAEKILSTFKQENIQKRRSDDSINSLELHKDANHQLLYDEGSSTYNDWLSRNSIYEDIYKNHDYTNKPADVLSLETSREEGTAIMKDELHNANVPLNSLNNRHINYENIAHQSADTQIVEQEPVIFHYASQNPVHHKKVGKSEQLTDIFEVALTAVAFLSFGMFVVQLAMSISSINSQATTTQSMFMPMSMNPTATAPDLGENSSNDNDPPSIDDNVSETDPDVTNSGTDDNGFNTGFDGDSDIDDRFNFRLKRGISEMSSQSTEALNEMSKRILSSMDAFLIADNGTCLEKSICTSNQYSTTLPGLNKFILPIWNLGLIWVQRTISNDRGSLAKGLQAAVLGLGNGHCKTLYRNCEVEKYK